MWSAALPNNEEIRLLTSLDPTEPNKSDRHVSASVGIENQIGSTRRCTEEEFTMVKVWAESEFRVKLQEEPYGKENPHVRHLWEVA